VSDRRLYSSFSILHSSFFILHSSFFIFHFFVGYFIAYVLSFNFYDMTGWRHTWGMAGTWNTFGVYRIRTDRDEKALMMNLIE
jgi:hypothetical protein